MKNLYVGKRSRLISIVLICALLISAMSPLSLAWEATPRVNAVNLFVSDMEIVASGESIEIEMDNTQKVIPASLLYGNVLYLSLPLLLESGMDIDFPEDNEENLTVEINGMDCTLAEPVYPRVQNDKTISLDMMTNFFNIIIDGKPFATMDTNIEFQDDSIPSLIWKENMMYFPIEPILQSLEIDSYWDNDSFTFIVGKQNQKEKVIGIENFKKINRYLSGQFSDVPSSTWYTDQVKAAFEYGLMVGTNDSSFNPSGNISIAEAVTIASRLHNTYYANDHGFSVQTPWYQSYVDYALDNQIIGGSYINYNTPISRSEFAYIIANTFPLPAINEVEDGAIPDVSAESDYYEAVYLLYRAGIISGTDSIGTFNPDANISRAEVAVILSSMVNENLRKRFTLKTPIFPTSIAIPNDVVISVGDSWTIPSTINPSNADRGTTVFWVSDNTSALEIDNNGTITGKRSGVVNVTATTENGISSTSTVLVQSQEDNDVLYARFALNKLRRQLKFPDTLEIYGIWAFTFPSNGDNVISISIYYGALTPMGLQSRREYSAYYNLNTTAFKFDDFEDSSHHSSVERVVDISQVLK